MKIRYQAMIGLAALALTLTGCSDADPIPDIDGAIFASKVNLVIPENYEQLIYTDYTGANVLPLIKGEKIELGCRINPENTTLKDLIWTSSEPNVASVDNGVVEALSSEGIGYSVIGVAPVGAHSGSQIDSQIKVLVADHLITASSIDIFSDSEELSVYEGNTMQLSVEISPEVATYHTVAWESSNPEVATVDKKGLVTAVSTGGGPVTPVTIKATALDGSGTTQDITVNVMRTVDPESVTILQNFSVDQGYFCAVADKKITLDITTVPAVCTTSLLEWTSSNENIATVENGVVTFNQNGNFGEFTITAKCPTTGVTSSIKMNMPAGLIRETFHDENNYTWDATSASTSTWFDGRLQITTPSNSYKRQDFKCTEKNTWLCAQNYPFFAIKMDDVKDQENVTGRNITFDNVGKNLSNDAEYKAGGNYSNNKWDVDIKCSDGSHVFVYNMLTRAFSTGGLLPTNGDVIQFTTFQFKYADIKINGSDANKPMTYNLYWIQTFKSIDDVKAYITDVDKLTIVE